MQAVLLAAGKGTRLRPLTRTTPKALIDICGKPLLQHILEALPDAVQEIFIIVGYLRGQVMERFGGTWDGKPIRYIVQDPLTGTGPAVHLAKDRLRGKFLVVNGDDIYSRADLERLIAEPLAILVQPTGERVVSAALADERGRFAGLEEGAPKQETKLRVCGAYVLDERFFNYPLAEIAVGRRREYGLPQTLVGMAKDCSIRVIPATFWQAVGTQAQLDEARRRCP